ncbi:RAD21/Rec8 N-terminal domain protein [Mycena kentingensis (nom. inval.)]|nr:RAD21/Rec8 N-terminal domain protein [Mycena kentingensis (nom. inval.)]
MPHSHSDDLRQIYEQEEIERYIALFSAYVTEVQLPDNLILEEDKEQLLHGANSSISQTIAMTYIAPLLPKTNATPPLFTLGRLRLTTERLYLATVPVYTPFITRLVKLALWEDRQLSLRYCSIFWTLWYWDLLLPALVLRILYSLLRRKLLPYPTLSELNAHRREIDRSNEFGRELTARFSATSSSGIRELWRIFRVFNKPKQSKIRGASQESLVPEQEAATALDSEKAAEAAQENDVKRLLLKVLADLADLHERVKNIFIWRRSAASKRYATSLLLIFLVTLLLPTKYLAKLLYFVVGFLYWHLAPVIAALPPRDRARFPPPFNDAPTDAEYAMELISLRVAAGLDVRPRRPNGERRETRDTRDDADDTASFNEASSPTSPVPTSTSIRPSSPREQPRSGVDWKKWGSRAAMSLDLVEDTKRVFTGEGTASRETLPRVETHTFPAQHTSAPGLITLTSDRLFFSSLVASKSKLEIPLSSLQSVKKKKKHGIFNSLTLTWADETGGMREEKFLWVGERDELFARLVGTVDDIRLFDLSTTCVDFPSRMAATLGSKSTFKKLPKRSILTADIEQLCNLIAAPEEPLALRLSSNLMMGVARVYKGTEIFYTDVTNCVASLKKVVQEIKTAAAQDLQMAMPTAKAATLNLANEPGAAYLVDFDALVADWDEFLNIGQPGSRDEDREDDFDPKATKSKKGKGKASKAIQPVEDVRGLDKHILKEHHEHLLSHSFDVSFNLSANSGAGAAGAHPSSSQAGGGFGRDDMFLGAADGLDIGDGFGDDLAKELGEGWGMLPDEQIDLQPDPFANQDPFVPMDVDFELPLDAEMMPRNESLPPLTPRKRKVQTRVRSGRPTEQAMTRETENIPPPNLRKQLLSPATSFSRLFLSQDEDQPQLPLTDITNDEPVLAAKRNSNKKNKKTRLLLDARTELTDEELKAEYLKSQAILRRGIEQKKAEKEGAKVLEDMIWAPPSGIQAETLIEFWQENFKVQVEARTGALSIHRQEEPPKKRRKIRSPVEQEPDEVPQENPIEENQMFGMHDMNLNIDLGGDGMFDDNRPPTPARRSSEEPGQARHVSRPPSVLDGRFEIEPQALSQRSSLFPWDNAGGASSSAGGFGPLGSDRISVDRADTKLRGASASRRESSLVPSQHGSVDGLQISEKGSQMVDDYAFDVEMPEQSAQESQQSDMNLITLERNSYNFLEYVKMQLQGLPSSATGLSFDTVVPKATSTRHVAAAAFYHCLVLTTKDLLKIEQEEPYGALRLAME